MHFAPTTKNKENLVRENVPAEQVLVTGNTDPRVAEIVGGDRRVVIVTAHRRENWGGGLTSIAAGVARVAQAHPDVQFVLPLHPNPRVRAELSPPLEPLDNVVLTEPLSYTGIARLLGRCELVITDSGGLQEEAPSLGKPVIVVRESTERTEGVEAGTLRLVGTDSDRIAVETSRLLDDRSAYVEMSEAANPYGDGQAAGRIVAALEYLYSSDRPVPIPFGPGFTRMAVLTAMGYDAWRQPLEDESIDESWEEHLPVLEEQ